MDTPFEAIFESTKKNENTIAIHALLSSRDPDFIAWCEKRTIIAEATFLRDCYLTDKNNEDSVIEMYQAYFPNKQTDMNLKPASMSAICEALKENKPFAEKQNALRIVAMDVETAMGMNFDPEWKDTLPKVSKVGLFSANASENTTANTSSKTGCCTIL